MKTDQKWYFFEQTHSIQIKTYCDYDFFRYKQILPSITEENVTSVGTAELALLWNQFFFQLTNFEERFWRPMRIKLNAVFFAEFPLKRGYQPYQFKVDRAKT